MTTTKRRIVITDDNYYDYFPDDFPKSLVARSKIGEDGIDRDGPKVAKLREYISRGNADWLDNEFVVSNYDAAVILELCAGWPDNFATKAKPTGKRPKK